MNRRRTNEVKMNRTELIKAIATKQDEIATAISNGEDAEIIEQLTLELHELKDKLGEVNPEG